MELVSIKAKHMCIHAASRAFLPLTRGFSVQSTLSRADIFGTGTKCPSYRESKKGSKERRGPTLGVRFSKVPVKREKTLHE